jgi:ABC-type antimicrobial peptide transport system permease subunit
LGIALSFGQADRIRSLSAAVSQDQVQADYQAIVGWGNRLAGSPGEKRAFDGFVARMKSLGATISQDSFRVTVPDPTAVGRLRAGATATNVYPLWPNLVRTSTCHVKGPLLYGGSGTLDDFQGKEVKGRIVLMEFDSGDNWRNAAKLGAEAVVFLEPRAMSRFEAELKFSAVPLDLPRFLLPRASAGPLLTAAFYGQEASLDCSQTWLDAQTQNVTATFPGTDRNLASQAIEIAASADSVSVAPGLNPGAESAGSIAGLFELARLASQDSHARPLKFVLMGAHCEALLGARTYAEHEFSDPSPPLLNLTLDLSSGSSAIGCYGRGWFYDFRDEQEVGDQTVAYNLHDIAQDIAAAEGINPIQKIFIDAVNNRDNRTWKNNIPGQFALDCEPMVLAGLNAITFRTVNDSRERVDTPFDTLDRVRVSNVVEQIRTSEVLIDHLLNDPLSKSIQSDRKVPIDPATPTRSRLIGGFATIAGQVVSYDPNKSFVPNIPQPGTITCVTGRRKTFIGVRGEYVQYAEGSDAQYRFDGLPTENAYSNAVPILMTKIQAFHLNQQSGAIDWAPTWNLPGFDAYDTFFDLTTIYRESPIVVFPCVSVDLYGLIDPQTLNPLRMTKVFDADTGSYPRNYSSFGPALNLRVNPEMGDSQVLFLSPGQRFLIMSGSFETPDQLILTNSTLTNEAGSGYTAPGGQPTGTRADLPLGGLFPNISLETATDLDAINSSRIHQFQKYRILSPDALKLESDAEQQIKDGRQAVATNDWASADRRGRAAWGLALRAHPIIMSTANDVVNGVVFYLFLLIPFSFFLERLIIGESLLFRQLAWVLGFFIASFLLLRLIHPAFEIVSNPSMIFIAFVMGALSLTVTFFIVGKFERSMTDVRTEQVGVHQVDIRRSSVAMAAFNLGVSNMRRRKARTILTTLTLVVMTFIVLSFTSIVSRLNLQETPSPNAAAYAGIFMRTPAWDPLEDTVYTELQNEFGTKANVLRRAYYFGEDTATAGVLSLQSGDNYTELRSMVGLDPAESDALAPQKALSAGRWFQPGDRNVTILPEPVAEALKIDPSQVGKATVTYAGLQLRVIGIANASVLRSLRDLDGDGLMPVDFTLSTEYQQLMATSNQAFRNFVRIDSSQVFIVPAETALKLGADLRTVAVQFKNPKDARPALQSLMPRLSLNLYAGVPNPDGSLEVREFSIEQGSSGQGIGLVIIQLLLASVFVLNTMIASVYERTREISIFSSIGLAPNHISMLFFAESLVYGILGAVIGYMSAQAVAKIIVMTGALPGLTLNFSSTSAVLSAAIVMGIVLLSTIYPARMAAKIAAPAVNEEAFESEPEGDVWELQLPFSVSAAEAGPIARFLTHWLQSYEGYTIGEFVTAHARLVEERDKLSVSATTWLAPYDLGVSQDFHLVFEPSPVPGVYALKLRLQRLSGDAENWPIVNRRFLANIRKQFLTWRTLTAEQRAPYQAAA